MKLKRRRALEVPPKIKSFIKIVITTPLENIQEPLKTFSWEFNKGDFHHWVDLFNHFDTFFEKFIKPRKDLQLVDDFLGSDFPFPKDGVLQILRVIRIVLENCTNKHFYSSYEYHLSSLLASTDADVVEASLQTLAAFLKKSIFKYIIRDASLNSRLFSFAQGWGKKEEGLGLVSCALQNGSDNVAMELGSTLHFEFYSMNESSPQGLQIIHIPDVNARKESDLELLNQLVTEYKVHHKLRFSLLNRLRFARAFSSLALRHQYTCIRLYAFVVLLQSSGETEDLSSFFHSEPEFINELVALLSYEDTVPEKIRILSLLTLVAICPDRTRQASVLAAVTSGGHHGILSSLMQKAINSIVNNSSKWSVVFVEALLSLVTVLLSSSSGCSAMHEAGFIPTLLPLLKDIDPQHLHLVTTAVHVLEAFMDYSNPAASLFRDLGGLDDTVSRLMAEVRHVENGSKQQLAFIELDNSEGVFSEALVSYRRRLLMKSLLRAISLGTYAPGPIARMYGTEDSLLPNCLCVIFKRAKDFGGGVFSLAATVMSDLIHKDPTYFPVLEEAGLPSAFMDAIMDGVLCSAEAITCIPQCLDALCLNNNGLQAVKERNALRCFVKVFTSKVYLRALAADTPSSLSSGLDELMRHASSLRGPGVDMLIEILNVIAQIGSGLHSASQSNESCSQSVPMETESENTDVVLSDDKPESSGQSNEASTDETLMNVDTFLPDCIIHVARLLEMILQNSDTCRIFVEKKGVECVLKLFTLPLMPLSVPLGQIIAVAFKNFSPQHSASLARSVCSVLRELLKSTDELLTSIQGLQLVQVEFSNRIKVLRCLSSLEGIISLCNSLLKGTTTIVSELGSSDLLKDLGKAYKELTWQLSLCSDSKQDVEAETESAAGPSNLSGRESDDDANIPNIRHMNPASIRNASHSHLRADRDFLSMVRASDGFSRRSHHSWARLRGVRTGRHLDAIDTDEGVSNTEVPLHEIKKSSPETVVSENLNKLASTLISFFTALVKGFTSPNRRRSETGSLSSDSKNIGTALAKIFFEALGFSGYPNSIMSPSVKCRYLGKIVNGMIDLTFDKRRRTCHPAMINNFYFHGTLKELLTTFEATCQLLWVPPITDADNSVEESKLSQNSWLFDTLQSHCRELEYFVNSGLLLSSSQSQLLVQPVSVGLSIGLFPVPRDPEAFVRLLQSQVLDVLLPIWNHPMFPNSSPGFVTSVTSLITHVCSGVSGAKVSNNVSSGNGNQRFMPPPPDEATISTIVEMGFSRARAEEALRRVETNSVEMAMEWLFSHAEDPVMEDDELARALALSLGNSSEMPKVDATDKSADVSTEEEETKVSPADDILAVAMKLQGSDSMAFPLTDLIVTLCGRNNGEDRLKVVSYLVQQLRLCPLDFSKDGSSLGMISHTLALVLSEDGDTREIAAQNRVVSIAIEILTNFISRTEASDELLDPKCISALLLILDNLVQRRHKVSGEAANEKMPRGPSLGSSENKISSDVMEEEKDIPASVDKDGDSSDLEGIIGNPTGYLTMGESRNVLIIACDFIKRHVPPMIMQAVFLLCARLTKSHVLAMQFLENGGMVALFGIPRSCFFPGYDTLASAIVRHLLEDPQTLQTAMELEIRQTLSGSRQAGRVSSKTFLTSMAPVLYRDPVVFMRAVAAVCQLDESSGGRSVVILSKDKEKEKDKSKAVAVETGVPNNESVRVTENKAQNKAHDGSGSKYPKSHKKISPNFTQVIDYLLEIVTAYPSQIGENGHHPIAMDIDEPISKLKGKAKVDGTAKIEPDNASEKSTAVAKVTFVLKLLSDILHMYVHAIGVILRRDMEICIVHHVLHLLLPISVDKSAVPDEWRDKLSEKASWFLVVLAGRSNEGRRRIVNELMKALSNLSSIGCSSSSTSILPDKKVHASVDLVYSILSKNSSSGSLPSSGCSPDITKSMIDGGMVRCLSGILQVIDLDHPDALKTVNIILKSLECLTRAANANKLPRTDTLNKKTITCSNERSDALLDTSPARQELQSTGSVAQTQDISENDVDQNANVNQPAEQEMGIEQASTADLGEDYMREDMEENIGLPDEEIEMNFHVENRVIDDMNDDNEEDDMGNGDDDEDEEDDDGEDEDGDIARDGTPLMSLADTDVDDHDDMVDEENDDFHESRVIEVRWREALDGLDHLQVLGQPGTGGGLINISNEPFEGMNVDDFFGVRRSFAFERRRQANRNEQPVIEGSNRFQHPLLTRPSRSGDFVSIWSSSSRNSSRDSEGISNGNVDATRFSTFGATTNFFDDLLGGPEPPTLDDFTVGLESLYVSGRRWPGDGRWTDDGQPQAGRLSAEIAQAVEERIIAQLRDSNPTENAGEIFPQNGDPVVVVDNPISLGIDNTHAQQNYELPHNNENQTARVAELESQEANLEAVAEQALEFVQENVTTPGLIGNNSMEAEEENAFDRDTLVNSSDSHVDGNNHIAAVPESTDVDMSIAEEEQDQYGPQLPQYGVNLEGSSSQQNDVVVQDAAQNDENSLTSDAPNANGIDLTFLEALPEDLRAEVLASQQARAAPPAPTYAPPTIEDIDPEFLAALPPDIQAEVLAQQRAQRIMLQSEGQPVDMDNASIIATFLADLREEVLLTSSEAELNALPSPLLAEAQMLRDRAMSHYHARSSLFGSGHRLGSRGNRIGFGQTVMDRGIGVSTGRGASSVTENMKLKELEGEPLLDANGLKALIRLLRLAQPLGKGLLQRLLLNLCSHSDTRAILVRLLLDMINPETVGLVGGLTFMSSQRLYGCQSEVVYGRSQVCDGVPPLVLRRVLEILTYLATGHSGISSLLFHFKASNIHEYTNINNSEKGKEKVIGDEHHLSLSGSSQKVEVPLILLLRLLGQPLFLQSVAHLEQVMGLLQVVVCAAASKVVIQSNNHEETEANTEGPSGNLTSSNVQKDPPVSDVESNKIEGSHSKSGGQKSISACDVFLLLPPSDLHNLCSLLGLEGLSDKVYTLADELLRKLASAAATHRKYFISELSESAKKLSSSAVNELITLKDTHMLGLSAGSMVGASVLRVLQILSALISFESDSNKDKPDEEDQDEHAIMWKLNVILEPLWKELSECISTMESELNQNNSKSSVVSYVNVGEQIQSSSLSSPPLPPGTQKLLPYIEGFFVLCEKLQSPSVQQDNSSATATEVKEHVGSSSQPSTKFVDTYRKFDGSLTFARFAERHRRLLNAFVRQNPGLLEKSLSVMLKAPRLIDFDNKKAYFRTKIRHQHDQHLSGPLRISVRRAYILEDSYNQLRMRPIQDLKGRLNVHFQGEEGIDAGGLTREWYQVLSRVVFDKGALLFTTVGNNATFQPNPNSVFQTEHLSYFRFVGRVVAKALLDGQLLDVYFTRSFYKHILGVKVTYHDIEAVDPDYYKNLKWMLENDVSDIPDLTFSMDADEEKHILYEKTEVTDYELKPGGRNIRVTEETKHEYVDLVADHILTNAIRPQINSFLEGFTELVPRELISIFNDKELELLISGLPEIDLEDMKANTEYTGYTVASSIVQWFWEVVKGFNKEDTARFLQFITGTSKVPLEGFKALQGISGPQRFQIHKAYGAPERLPSAHTCFNQLDLPAYSSKEQLQERLLLAIHEASEGFGFG